LGTLPGGMDTPPPVSDSELAAAPASVFALIQWQARQIAQLQREVAELKARLNKDSTNSSMPPSATHPHAKPLAPKPRSKRRRGGQPGHDKHERALIRVEDCQAVAPPSAGAAAGRCAALIPSRCGTRSGSSPTSSRW